MTAWKLIAQFLISIMYLDCLMCNPAIEIIGLDLGKSRLFYLVLVAEFSVGAPTLSTIASLGSGILAMDASEKKRIRSSCHSSCCSSTRLPTNRV